MGTTEEWLSLHLAKEPEFQTAIGLSTQQIKDLDPGSDEKAGLKRNPKQSKTSSHWFYWTADDPYRIRLQSVMTDSQRSKLLGVYLHVEGLMALGRPEFQKLLNISPEKQKQIEEMAAKVCREVAAPCQQAFFVMRSQAQLREELPAYQAELRLATAKLDRDVLNILDRKERCELLRLIREAEPLRKTIRTPGPYPGL
jgi:hypothetical protein